ncbi:hypothetical protein RTM1035_17137 [Roseovarius sp. TM1035]|nr:hypothetical protein RTM1035_17137 [Roseovarius sp. TM1035]
MEQLLCRWRAARQPSFAGFLVILFLGAVTCPARQNPCFEAIGRKNIAFVIT